jgi:hypothetical protein|tara:strand:+ start:77 stop:292 length:216 start_codon:yes stop_codon:yes gene_type:complete
MVDVKCLKCGGEEFWGVEFDGYCLQCKACKSTWNSKYSFFLARNNDEEDQTKKDQAKKGGDTATTEGRAAS